MMHTHKTLKRRKGTGYAYEGIVHGYKLAKDRNLTAAVDDIGYTIDRGLYKLTSWQVQGPLADQNKFLTENPTDDPLAIGGHMNHKRQAPLRIDVTQHTLHAQLLALQYDYTE
jgi:UDP-N-acetylmuramoyl-tripeptide--D-alanyl-D-alanine ligase